MSSGDLSTLAAAVLADVGSEAPALLTDVDADESTVVAVAETASDRDIATDLGAVALSPAAPVEIAAVPVAVPVAAESPALPSIASLPAPGEQPLAPDEDNDDDEVAPPVANQVEVLFEAPALELASDIQTEDRSGEPPVAQQAPVTQKAAAPITAAPIALAPIEPAAPEPVVALTTVERYSAVVKEVRQDLKAKAWDVALKKVDETLGLEDLIGEQRGWLLYLKARAERGRGHPVAAARLYAEAIDFDPPGTHYKNSLAWVLATSKNPRLRDVPRAVRLAEEAVQEKAGKAQYLDTLARAYFEAGRFGDAVATQQKALSRVPQNSRYRRRLAWYQGEAVQIAGTR